MPALNLLPSVFSEMFFNAIQSGSLNKTDRYGIMAALLENRLDVEEQKAIDLLLRAAAKGRIALVD